MGLCQSGFSPALDNVRLAFSPRAVKSEWVFTVGLSPDTPSINSSLLIFLNKVQAFCGTNEKYNKLDNNILILPQYKDKMFIFYPK